jgi:hypothetical protein
MNLPLELQRRLDRRWSARFRRSEQGSRPAPMVRTVVKAQALAVNLRVEHPVPDENSGPASCSTRQFAI